MNSESTLARAIRGPASLIGPDQLCCYGVDERRVVEPDTFTVRIM